MRKMVSALLTLTLALSFAMAAGAEKTVTLSFTGDVTLGSEAINWDKPESFNGYADREGYGWFFRNMKELFSSDDLTLVNLEGVLSDSSLMEERKKTFRFRGPTDYVNILKQSSIEACGISNNHIMDFGKQGYESTMATLKEHGVLFCGNDHCFVFEKDGIRIAFFALGSTYFFQYKPFVEQTLAALREEGLNAVICSFHAGQEYSTRRRDRDQERFARIAVEEWGADLVIMHHPHVLQGVDILNDRYVFYSLGNFCFGGNMFIRALQSDARVRTLESMVVQMDLVFSDEGEYLGQQGRIYPCYISSSAAQVNDPNDFQPKFVFGEEAEGVVSRLQADTKFDLGAVDEKTGILFLPYLKVPGAEAPKGPVREDYWVPSREAAETPSGETEATGTPSIGDAELTVTVTSEPTEEASGETPKATADSGAEPTEKALGETPKATADSGAEPTETATAEPMAFASEEAGKEEVPDAFAVSPAPTRESLSWTDFRRPVRKRLGEE